MTQPTSEGGIWQTPAAHGPVHATVTPPGSKSITNRALVLAALSRSPSVIRGVLRARDTLLATAALRNLGSAIEDFQTHVTVRPGTPAAGSVVGVDVGNAGTVMRFLPAVAALTAATVTFDGDARAAQRPVGALLTALRALGADIDDEGRGALPFTVRGTGRVRGGVVTLDASGSSQLVSGLLLAAPLFAEGAEVHHEGPPVPSLPHIEMTVRMLRAAGANVWLGADGSPAPRTQDRAAGRPTVWRVERGDIDLGDFVVEPDLSNAAPFLAAALVTGGTVTIPYWPKDSLQAADQILGVLTEMGARASVAADGLTVTGSGTINGIEADLRDINELAPVLTAVASLACSPSRFTGLAHTRQHETDRLAAMATEINALGGNVTEFPDGLQIKPSPLRATARPFGTYDDHRLVMAAAVLGLAVPGLPVANAATVGKTFPEFMAAWSTMLEPDS